jgi:polysaccharide biosynthesis transport protein
LSPRKSLTHEVDLLVHEGSLMTKQNEMPGDAPRRGTEIAVLASEVAADHRPAVQTGLLSLPSPSHDDDAARRPIGGITLYLHAFRRHWPLAISLGLLCASLVVAAAWFLIRDRYTATSLLQISANEQHVVFQTVNQTAASPFEIYKGTQQQKIASEMVLIAALRRPEAAGLAVIQKEDDPVRWLAKHLRVDFPGNAEIMRVSLTGDRPDEAAVLVSAVVEAYMNEAVDSERKRKAKRQDELDRLYGEKEMELRRKRTELKRLAELLGTGEPGALALKQQIALQQYAEARNELSRLRTELQRTRDDLQTKMAWIKALESEPPSAADPEAIAAADPIVAKLTDQIEELDSHLAELRQRLKGTFRTTLTADYVQKKASLQKKLEERRQQLAKTVKKSSKINFASQLAELNARITVLAAQEELAAKELDQQRKNAEKFGNSSVDIEMMRGELQYLDKVLTPIADEREKLKVELQSMPRISVIQPVEAPKSPDSNARLQNVVLGGTGSFLGVIFLVLWVDVRKQRINSTLDLDRGLGLTVVGTVPLLPQKMMHAKKPIKGSRKWQASLDRAVDSIAARLFLRKEATGVRVVLVSSATQGEGKTSLAIHLAKRLASTGERTLLVDFDLRRPAVHRLFGVPRGPGVGECLEQGVEPSQVVRATDTANLSIISAGSPLFDSLGRLSNGATTAFFAKARAGFTFVIVDGSPILPVIDGLLASQHADTVVLSVRRDKSEAPHVLRACEKLAAFGSRNYVVVLNGSQEENYGDYHEPTAKIEVKNVGDADPAPRDNSVPPERS